jgi:hypothetical protein
MFSPHEPGGKAHAGKRDSGFIALGISDYKPL